MVVDYIIENHYVSVFDENKLLLGAALNFCYSLFQRPVVAQKLVVFHSQKAVSNVCLT